MGHIGSRPTAERRVDEDVGLRHRAVHEVLGLRRELEQRRELAARERRPRRVREDLAARAKIEEVEEVGRVPVENAGVEGVQEAVVGSDVDDLAALGLEVGEVEVRLRRRRARRRQVARQVLEVPRRLDHQRLGVEDVAQLVRVTGGRRVARVRGIAELRRGGSGLGYVVLVVVGEVGIGRGTDRGYGRRLDLVQDLVSSDPVDGAILGCAAAKELHGELRGLLGGGAPSQAHVCHQVVEARARSSRARTRSGVGKEIRPDHRHIAHGGGGSREDHLPPRPNLDGPRVRPARERGIGG